MPLSEDLQPPPKARTKHSEDGRGTTTGYERPAEKESKDSRNRGRVRLSHDISPKPQKTPNNSILAYFEEEAEKEDGASCVFLLWGSANSESFNTWAVDVPTTRLESEDLIFASLAKRYAEELDFWRRWLSFRKFSKLKPVNFRLISRSSKRFLAFVVPWDLHKLLSRLEDEAAICNACLCDEFLENGTSEQHDRLTDAYFTNTKERFDPDYPEEELDRIEPQMLWIAAAPFLSCYFRNPAGAQSQNILDRLYDYQFIHSYRDISTEHHRSEFSIRYVQRNGLYIETTWDPIKCLFIFFGLLICALAVGKLCWGSWEITFGAGSFLVALPMLVLTVFSYYDV